MPRSVDELPPRKVTGDDPKRREEKLLTIVPRDAKKVYQMRSIINWVADTGSDTAQTFHFPVVHLVETAEIKRRLESIGKPFRGAEHFIVEEIIDPRDTRRYLCDFRRTGCDAAQAGAVAAAVSSLRQEIGALCCGKSRQGQRATSEKGGRMRTRKTRASFSLDRKLGVCMLSAGIAAGAATARAQPAADAWPAKPVAIIIPVTPGGGVDTECVPTRKGFPKTWADHSSWTTSPAPALPWAPPMWPRQPLMAIRCLRQRRAWSSPLRSIRTCPMTLRKTWRR